MTRDFVFLRPLGLRLGKVMRLMMEETKGKQVELLDGIKVYDRDGWALIMPDLDQPHFRVITQGVSKEKASNLAQLYAERIQQYQETLNTGRRVTDGLNRFVRYTRRLEPVK